MPRKTNFNWERIEIDYRAGVKTLREIGEENGITHAAINKRAKRDGWIRDLTAKIRAQADALVSKDLVSEKVTKEKKLLETEVVKANAEVSAAIQKNQRKDVTKARELTTKLMSELEEIIDNKALLEDLAELMHKPDARGDKLNEIYRKIIAFPGRVSSVKQLTEALKTAIEIERKVYKIDENPEAEQVTAIKVRFT